MDNEIIYDLPIYNEEDQLITNPDLTLGFLTKETIIDIIPAIPAKTHYFPISMYFDDGTSILNPKEDDPHIDKTNASQGRFGYIDQGEGRKLTGMTVSLIVDSPAVPEQKTETEIYRYILYTEEELVNRTFLTEGPERLTNVETDTEDLLQVVADLAGSDIKDRVAENQETIDELLLVMADLLGGNEEEA